MYARLQHKMPICQCKKKAGCSVYIKAKQFRNLLKFAMSDVRWDGKTSGSTRGNAESLAPCARALAFEMERIDR